MKQTKAELLFELLEDNRIVEVIYQDKDEGTWSTLDIDMQIIQSFLEMLLVQERSK